MNHASPLGTWGAVIPAHQRSPRHRGAIVISNLAQYITGL